MKQHNIVMDELESMILMSLDANNNYQKKNYTTYKNNNVECVSTRAENSLRFDDMKPKSCFTMDMSDDSRIYTGNYNLLLNHPSEIIGSEKEVMIFRDNKTMSWCGIRKTKKPLNVSTIGKASFWYEMHFRDISFDNKQTYSRAVVPINNNGKPLLAKLQKSWTCNSNMMKYFIYLSSVIEDSFRPNAMLATVKDSTEIIFPVPLDDYKNIFLDREGPMSGARKKAIIHWVAKHIRKSKKGNSHNVKKHTRGVDNIIVDGLNINIQANI